MSVGAKKWVVCVRAETLGVRCVEAVTGGDANDGRGDEAGVGFDCPSDGRDWFVVVWCLTR